MSSTVVDANETGLEVSDLRLSTEFAARPVRPRVSSALTESILRLYDAFLKKTDNIQQELVDSAIDLCGADSAGISIEQVGENDNHFWLWTATAGKYSVFGNSTLPRYPSACGICLARGCPQTLRVTQRFFDLVGVEAETVTDGILFPWRVGETRGTFWILAHGRREAFDCVDLRIMQSLADFAAIAMKHGRRRQSFSPEVTAASAMALATDLANQVNDQLLTLLNVLHLSSGHESNGDEDRSRKIKANRARQVAKLLGFSKLDTGDGLPN